MEDEGRSIAAWVRSVIETAFTYLVGLLLLAAAGAAAFWVAWPFFDAWMPRSITGEAWQQLGITGAITEYRWTSFSVLGANRDPAPAKHYFVVSFNNRSDRIVQAARVNLTIKAADDGRVLFDGVRQCDFEGGLHVPPTETGECGFPLPATVSDHLARGAKADFTWSIDVEGTGRPIRLVAIVGGWLASLRMGAQDAVDSFWSLFEKV